VSKEVEYREFSFKDYAKDWQIKTLYAWKCDERAGIEIKLENQNFKTFS
jgi:hypothetical protein